MFDRLWLTWQLTSQDSNHPPPQVVNGFMQHRAALQASNASTAATSLAVLPLGSANDFAKSHNW